MSRHSPTRAGGSVCFVLSCLVAPSLAMAQVPVVNAGLDQNIYLGDTAVLNGTATNDPILWEWKVISAPTGSNYGLTDADTANPLFSAGTKGNYVITAAAWNYHGWSQPDAMLVTVAPNQRPTAVATATPLSGPDPLVVTFDGTLSTDPEGGPLLYNWIFDDGTPDESGPTPTHTYDTRGVYQAVLCVLDERGLVDCDAVVITVTLGGNAQVSPQAYDFGDVGLGTSSTTIITIMNPLGGTLDDPLSLATISLQPGGSGDFAVTVNPAGSTVLPGESVDVEITFTPTAEGYVSATLQIASDDPVCPLIEVALGGVGVWVEPPPEGQIAAILAFVAASVEAGSLVGDGPGGSAEGRLSALRNMIEACGDLIAGGWYEEASGQLAAALQKCDGQPRPPDFVAGPAAAELWEYLMDLAAALAGG